MTSIEGISVASMILGLSLLAGFLGLPVPTWFSVAVAIIAYVRIAWPKRWAVVLIPVALLALGLIKWTVAIFSVGLLLVGPVVLLIPVVFVEFIVGELLKTREQLDRYALWQIARPRALILLFVVVNVVGAIQSSLWLSVALVPAFVACWFGARKSAIAAALLVAWTWDWSWSAVTFAAILLGVEIWRRVGLEPRQRLPFRAARPQHSTGWFWLWRCDHHLRRAHLVAAERALSRLTRSTRDYRVRAAYLDLERRRYQRAIDLDAADTGDGVAVTLRARALSATGQFEQADRALNTIRIGDLRRDERYLVNLVRAENELAAGEIDAARHLGQDLWDAPRFNDDYFMRPRAARVLSDCALRTGDLASAEDWAIRGEDAYLQNRVIRYRVLSMRSNSLVRALTGKRAPRYLDLVQHEIQRQRCNANWEENDWGWDPSGAGMALSIARHTDAFVDLLGLEVQRERRRGRRSQALSLACRALMELDGTRYELAAQSARTSWSIRFRLAVDTALDLAHEEHDAVLLAELVEFARVQTLPVPLSAGQTDLALGTPPIVTVQGRSRLGRPDGGPRPEPVELTDAARRAAGPGAWWLSYWQSGGWLYWATVPPTGAEVAAGRVPFADDSPARQVLNELAEALPVAAPGESASDMDFRLARSPLVVGVEEELKLSRRLGEILLPDQLVQAALAARQNGNRLPLAIAPAACLGYTPWSLLVIERDTQAGVDVDRLVDMCDWVLAPSAALIAQVTVPPDHPTPLSLVVVDTVDTPALSALDGARRQASTLPPDIKILGGSHWTEQVATFANLSSNLRSTGPAVTIAFFCHAIRGTDGEPSRGGLLLGASDSNARAEDMLLTPSAILEMAAAGIRMPTRVLLQACDTSALTDAESGEWLTVAPAFLAGGSSEVVTTLFPLPDVAMANDPVTAAAVDGESLRTAVRTLQRSALVRWTAGQAIDLAHLPISWASYAVLGVSCETKVVEREISVSLGVLKVLAEAFRTCRNSSLKLLDSGVILGEILDYTDTAEILDGGGDSLMPTALFWTLGPHVMGKYLRIRDRSTRQLPVPGTTGTVNVSETAVRALREAMAKAQTDGSPLGVHHLFASLLGNAGAARKIASVLSTVTGRPANVLGYAVDHHMRTEISEGHTSRDSLGMEALAPEWRDLVRWVLDLARGELDRQEHRPVCS